MIRENLSELFERDINKLKQELEQYRDESSLWVISKDIKNSSGNLALHIIGNLKHYFGAVLSSSGYIRHRDSEFSLKNIPLSELLKELEEARSIVRNTLMSMDVKDLDREYPEHVYGKPMSSLYFFLSLLAHLNYHLGQVNYHRRLLS